MIKYNTLTEEVCDLLVEKLREHGYVNKRVNKDYTRYYIKHGDEVV